MNSLKIAPIVFNSKTLLELVEISMNVDFSTINSENSLELFFENDFESFKVTLEIVGTNESKSNQGIHLVGFDSVDDLSFRIGHALEDCFRDGFQKIWIHQ